MNQFKKGNFVSYAKSKVNLNWLNCYSDAPIYNEMFEVFGVIDDFVEVLIGGVLEHHHHDKFVLADVPKQELIIDADKEVFRMVGWEVIDVHFDVDNHIVRPINQGECFIQGNNDCQYHIHQNIFAISKKILMWFDIFKRYRVIITKI